ncbi:hypothetical protein HK104_003292, partial [Borealophlyctis nickersoniae]
MKTQVILLLTACLLTPLPIPSYAQTLARLEPPDGKHYFAVWPDMNPQGAAEYPAVINRRLPNGLNIPVFHFAQNIPIGDTLIGNRLKNQTNEALLKETGTNAGMILTLYANAGLDGITDGDIKELADQLHGYEKLNISVWLRFAPEMDGWFNEWGQRPTLYRETWTRIARALRTTAPTVALVFSPNFGYSQVMNPPARNSTDFALLDTNKDGVLDEKDDAKLAYYPGDEWVDWVGMSAYHVRFSGPYWDNVMPDDGEMERMVDQVYKMFAIGRGKPMMLSESGAAFNPNNASAPGFTELSTKQAFWRQ